MKALFISMTLLLSSTAAQACMNDYGCNMPAGERCVAPANSINGRGICVREVQNGAINYNASYGNTGAPQVKASCQYDYECSQDHGYGSKCVKMNGNYTGICIK